jgi:hypothetical protein
MLGYKELSVLRGPPEFRVFKEPKATLDLRDRKAFKEILDSKGLLGCKAPKVVRVVLGLKEIPECRGMLVFKGDWDPKVPLAIKANRVYKEFKATKASKGVKVGRERVPKDRKATKAVRAGKVKAYREPKATKAIKDGRAKEFKDLRGLDLPGLEPSNGTRWVLLQNPTRESMMFPCGRQRRRRRQTLGGPSAGPPYWACSVLSRWTGQMA